MMTKTQTTTITGESQAEMPVLAYRVGQLEIAFGTLQKTVEQGQEKLDKKLTDLMLHFATVESVESLKREAHTEHVDIREDIDKAQKAIDELTKWKDAIVGKIAASAVVMLVLMVLASYGIDKFLK